MKKIWMVVLWIVVGTIFFVGFVSIINSYGGGGYDDKVLYNAMEMAGVQSDSVRIVMGLPRVPGWNESCMTATDTSLYFYVDPEFSFGVIRRVYNHCEVEPIMVFDLRRKGK